MGNPLLFDFGKKVYYGLTVTAQPNHYHSLCRRPYRVFQSRSQASNNPWRRPQIPVRIATRVRQAITLSLTQTADQCINIGCYTSEWNRRWLKLWVDSQNETRQSGTAYFPTRIRWCAVRKRSNQAVHAMTPMEKADRGLGRGQSVDTVFNFKLFFH